jgi:uracil-DNA glycosylase
LSRLTQPLSQLLDASGATLGDWLPLLQRWRNGAAGQALIEAVDRRVADGAVVYPGNVFRALALTPLAQTRVLILGQDPYHGPGQAEGLAFSVAPGQRPPPSLRNIFKELRRDLGLPLPSSGSLRPWADRGVLLLNATLTVEDGCPGSHAKLGWHALTDAICVALAADVAPKVFMLWGAHAQAKRPLLEGADDHLVLQSNHPSPLSALRPPLPFAGCGHFGAAARHLAHAGRGRLDWSLP